MVNKAILVGNLGNDPDVKTTNSGKHVASFSMATSERYKDKTTGEAKVITDWHNVVLWGSLADIAGKYLKKGSKVYIEGKIRTRSYETNGTKKYMTEIIGDNLTMLGEKPGSHQVEQATGIPASATHNSDTDDLPF